MKTFSLFFCTFFVFSIYATAQTQDLLSLAKGNYLGMNALFNEQGDVYGYISIYDYGKSGEKTKKFEYVILDKNLNPVANNTFEGDITAGNYIGYLNYNDQIILIPNRLDLTFVNQNNIFSPASIFIDLKNNTVHQRISYDYDHGVFTKKTTKETWNDIRKENKAEKKKNGFNYVSSVVEIKEGGYLVLEYDDYGSYENNNHILRYDTGKKELWKYEYNTNGSKKASQSLSFLEKDESHFYGLLKDRVRTQETYYLVVIDMKTGKEIYRQKIVGSKGVLSKITHFSTSSYGELDNDKTFDDKIVLVGKNRLNVDVYYTTIGLARLIIDKKTFKAQLDLLSYEDDYKKYIPKINKYGNVEKGYFLDARDIFFLKDGSVGVLYEKYKTGDNYSGPKTTDLIYVYTDKDFKIAGAKVFEKEKSKWSVSDYLFSQYLNDGNDLVFFYRDYQKNNETKERNWNLFINTLIGGKFKQEVIPISSKENYMILPYVAKEGYILLQEFSTKAKENQIRLERLNY